MGSLSSKVGRTLPTKTRASAGGEVGSKFPPHPVSRSKPVARETKDQDIERDGKDPHLLANLGRIGRVGQVNIHSPSGSTSANIDQVSKAYKTRDLAEQQANSTRPVHNRLGAGSLSNLLDDRKAVASRRELEELAARYTVDTAVLESLARFVNTPSVGEGTVVRTLGEEGEEKITMKAVWIDPIFNTK